MTRAILIKLYACIITITTVVSIFIVAGCSGGSGGSGGGGASSTSQTSNSGSASIAALTQKVPVSDADFSAAWDSFSQISKATYDAGMLQGYDQATIAKNTLAAINTAPPAAMADAGLTPDGQSVWMRLKDGTPFGQFTPRESLTPTLPKVALREAINSSGSAKITTLKTSMKTVAAGASVYKLPSSDTAFLSDFSSLAPDSMNRIAVMLKARKYKVTPNNRPDLTDMMNVKGYGVVWMSTHSGPLYDDQGVLRFAFGFQTNMLNTPCASGNAALCKTYRDEIKFNRIFPYSDKTTGVGHWAVAPEFIAAHWKLADNSLVFFDSCDSYVFIDALKIANAGTILTWDAGVSPVFSQQTSSLFFDRILGGDTYQRLSPPQRPFSASEVYNSMAAKGKIIDPNPKLGAKLVMSQANASFDTILVPSIMSLYADEDTKLLKLFGEFGSTQGTVDIDGTPGNVVSWSDKEILVDLIDSHKGPVTVTIGQIPSNPVPLTEWVGTYDSKQYVSQWNLMTGVNITGNYGSGTNLYTLLSCSRLRWRGDIHPTRYYPEDAAQLPPVMNTYITRDSICSSTAGGTNTVDTAQYTLTAPVKPLTWTSNSTSTTSDYTLYGNVTMKPRDYTVVVNVVGFVGPATIANSNSSGSGSIPLGSISIVGLGSSATSLSLLMDINNFSLSNSIAQTYINGLGTITGNQNMNDFLYSTFHINTTPKTLATTLTPG